MRILILILLASCAHNPKIETELYAQKNGWHSEVVRTPNFDLQTYHRIYPGQPTTVIIEGDGFAYETPTIISEDPTPLEPKVLRLAGKLVKQNVIYLSRPCQYGKMRGCHYKDWTLARYSAQVRDTINQAINHFQERYGFSKIRILGFSGGGTMAALIAAMRHDVSELVTLAGNLSIDKFTLIHDATPLKGSLNPIHFASQLHKIPQLHLVGENDDRVPLEVALHYKESFRDHRCIQIKQLSDLDHFSDWSPAIEYLDSVKVTCKKK